MLTPSFSTISDRGMVREHNEDNVAVDSACGLFVVADGMGGHLAGDLASQIAVEALPKLIRERLDEATRVLDDWACEDVADALGTLNREMVEQTRGEPGLENMGATVVLALIRDCAALITHLGDSRAYLLRAGELRPLTRDHSIVQLLLDRGEISTDEVADHPSRGQITRFIGMRGNLLPDVSLVELQDADRLLLCTDGLTGMLSDGELRDILMREDAAENACHCLVSAANEAGGRDNVTAIVIDLVEEKDG